MSKSGNVRREPKARVEEIPHFEAGDIVSLTPAVLRRRDFANMTPRLLYEIGHPNEFHVLRAVDLDEDGPCVTLADCCSWDNHEGFVDRHTGKHRCTGHPSILFEKKGVKRSSKKGDKSTSIHLPFMPFALAGINWEEDENSPALKAQVMGKEISITGPIAKLLKDLAEENNIL